MRDAGGSQSDVWRMVRDEHNRLHQTTVLADLACSGLSHDRYRNLMSAMARLHVQFAALCRRGWGEVGLSSAAHLTVDRVSAIEQDLAFLGLPPPSPPLDGDVTVYASDGGFAVGCLYVIHGSTRGAMVVHRKLDRLCEGEDGRRFWSKAHGDEEALRDIRAAIDCDWAQPSRTAAIASGALHTMRAFRVGLERI